jgi:hypothetical protein
MRDELTVTFDEADFVEAYRPVHRRRRLAALLLILALLLALLIVVLLVRFPEARVAFQQSSLIMGLTGAVMLTATLLFGLLLAAPALRRRTARSILSDHPGMRDPVTYTFDPDHFTMQSTYSQARYPWAQLWDWRESERVLIVMPTPRNFYVLPKRGVDPAVLARLRSYLAQARKRVNIS